MSLVRRRTLARAGVIAAALLATGAFFTAPAQASDNVELAGSIGLAVNIDKFAVFGTEPAGGGGSLPVTGVQVGLIGVLGMAIVAIGGVLVLLSRRRRIVTVAPEDESTRE